MPIRWRNCARKSKAKDNSAHNPAAVRFALNWMVLDRNGNEVEREPRVRRGKRDPAETGRAKPV